MRKWKLILGMACLAPVMSAVAAEAQVKSKHSLEETANRFMSALNNAGVGAAKGDAAAGSAGASDTTILFANPLYETNIGRCRKGARKDIPLEARVHREADGTVWLVYNTPDAPINQFGVIECGNEADKMRKLLGGFANSAAE